MTNNTDIVARFAGWRVKQIIAVCMAVLCFGLIPAKALIVDLDAYVDLAILQEDMTTPLADGSWVFIMGSGDAVNDGMLITGTNVIASFTQGDDVILGMIQIPLNQTNGSGAFFVTVQYESDDINYAYLRFFNTTSMPITGLLWWGTSSMFQLGVTLGVATVQFDQDQQLMTTNQNNFVVIPEPNSLNLFVLVAGMLWTIRTRMRWASTADPESKGASPVA